MSFGHSIDLVAAMVIGGSASIVGSILGGAYYVLVPQLTNRVDPASRRCCRARSCWSCCSSSPAASCRCPAR